MNIVPKQNFADEPYALFRREKFDLFAPLEILDGNSMCDYMIEQPHLIEDGINYLKEIDNKKDSVLRIL